MLSGRVTSVLLGFETLDGGVPAIWGFAGEEELDSGVFSLEPVFSGFPVNTLVLPGGNTLLTFLSFKSPWCSFLVSI